jgi:hypothetical protein
MADSQLATPDVGNAVPRVSAREQSWRPRRGDADDSFARDHEEDAMIDANTTTGLELMAAERRADHLRAAQQHRQAKLARQRREATARRTRLLRLVTAPTR